MNNNIEFSIMPNKTNTKFKIAWTVNLGEYPTTKTLSKEFGSEELAQEYLDNNKDMLAQKIRERISKIAISLKEEVVTEEVTEEVVAAEEVTEEVAEEVVTEEVVAEEVTEEVAEEVVTEEVVAEEVAEEVVAEEVTEEVAEEVVAEEVTEEVAEEVVTEEENDDELVSKEIISVEEFDLNEESAEEKEEVAEEVSENLTDETDEELRALVFVESEELEAVPRKTKKKHIGRRILAIILAFVLGTGAGYWIHKLHHKDEVTPEDLPTEPGIEAPVHPEIEDEEEELTTEEFETLTANFIKMLQDKNVNVTTQDITKFVAIVNIDRLVQENPELANTLFKEYTKEEYIQDAANIIGRTCQYNAKTFDEEKSTENFIKLSESLYGEQKEQVEIIESYVDRIAAVYYDAEQVNAIVAELSARLLTGDLQNLDYGVQFAIQSSIELIRSYIARNVLNEENLKVLTEITRLDVTEIMYMFDNVQGLTGTAKTLN